MSIPTPVNLFGKLRDMSKQEESREGGESSSLVSNSKGCRNVHEEGGYPERHLSKGDSRKCVRQHRRESGERKQKPRFGSKVNRGSDR